MNNIVLTGRICQDIELKQTTSGISVVSINIAVDRRYTTKGGEKQTDFIPVVAWQGTAEFISKYFRKGQMIAVIGELQTRKYEKNGEKRTVYEVVANQVEFCGDKKSESAEAAPNFAEVKDDDLPF